MRRRQDPRVGRQGMQPAPRGHAANESMAWGIHPSWNRQQQQLSAGGAGGRALLDLRVPFQKISNKVSEVKSQVRPLLSTSDQEKWASEPDLHPCCCRFPRQRRD